MIAYCPSGHFQAAAEEAPLRCPVSGQPLEYRDLPPFDPEQIESQRPGHWRYLAMLPVIAHGHKLFTLGEGWTPLIEDEWFGQPLYWKFEGLMPSGSYKDRGVSVIINWLIGQGAQTVMDDSSGNAGASLACYAARAGLFARIFVPAYAPEPKKVQIAVYGAELVEVSGPRASATQAAEASQTNDTVYASHAWHPACLLGFMTNAWEIWEQLGRKVPDWFISPVGYGGLFLGAWRGFQHLHRSGIIAKLPRMVAVQAEPITPICNAFHEGRSEVVPHRQVAPSALADGISVEKPVRSRSILWALHQSGGTAISVNDEEILVAQEHLAQRGLFVEPTSATAAAALTKLAPLLDRSDSVIVNLTGLGLKRLPAV